MGLGYQGYAKLGTSLLLANTTGLEVQINPIMSTAVFGSGWANAAQTTNFADNQLTYEGPIDFDLQGSGDIWDYVRAWAIEDRATPQSLELSPDGSVVYSYTFSELSAFDGAWNSALSLSFDPESIVRASATAVAIKRTETFNDLPYFSNDGGLGIGPDNPLNPSGARNLSPIPGWNSRAAFVTDGNLWENQFDYDSDYAMNVLNYNFDITNNTIIVRACNGRRTPAAVLQGTINTTGSVTLYREGGIHDVAGLDSGGDPEDWYIQAENTYLGINIGNTLYVKIPYVLLTASDYGVKGQNELSTKTLSFQGLGTGADPGDDGSTPIIFPDTDPLD